MSTLGAAQFSANIRLLGKPPLDLTKKFGEVPAREFFTRENLYAGSTASLTESEARTILRARSLDDAGDRIFAAGQESLRATRPGVFSEARPPSRAQVLEARGISDSSGEARFASSPSPSPDTIDWKKYPPVFRNVYADVLAGRGLAEIAKQNGIKERTVTNIINRISVRTQALDKTAGDSTPRRSAGKKFSEQEAPRSYPKRKNPRLAVHQFGVQFPSIVVLATRVGQRDSHGGG